MPPLHDAPGGQRWITVSEEHGTRYLYLDGCEAGAMRVASEEPVFHYLWFHKCSQFVQHPVCRALVLGAGAFTAAKCLAIDHPGAVIDAVDEEPELGVIGWKFFDLDQPAYARIEFHGVPAEEFLAGERVEYDFIFDDMFDGYQHVPIAGRGADHFRRLCALLPNGVCVKNVIWSPRSADTRASCAETIAACRAAFSAHTVLTLGDPAAGHNELVIGATASIRFDWPSMRSDLAAAGVPDFVLENTHPSP